MEWWRGVVEKANPYHDPATGRFTFAHGHGTPLSLTPAARARLDASGTPNPLPSRGPLKIPAHMSPEIGQRFEKWFGNGAMRNEHGEPLVLTHGTRHDFKTFGVSETRFSTQLGPHFALDPNMTAAFSVGTYAQKPGSEARYDQINAEANGRPVPAYIPIVNGSDRRSDRRGEGMGSDTITSEPRAHGSPEGLHLNTYVHGGGRTIPVYANVKRPRIVAQRAGLYNGQMRHAGDDEAVRDDAGSMIFQKRPDLFIRAARAANIDPEFARAVHAHFTGGPKLVHDAKDHATSIITRPGSSITSLGAYVRESSLMSMPYYGRAPEAASLRRAFVRAYKQDLKRMGYDSILYVNTSSNEVTATRTRNASALIVFGPQQVKSIFASKFNPKAHQFTKADPSASDE